MPQTVRSETSKDIIGGIAVTSLLIGIAANLPIIGSLSTLLLPIPVLFYRLKIGRGYTAVIVLATLGLTAVLLDTAPFDLMFFGALMALGFALAECLERRLSIEKTIMYAVGAVLGAGAMGIMAYSQAAHIDIVQLVSAYVAKNLELIIQLYEDMGVPEETIHAIAGALPQLKYSLVRILPAIVTALTLLLAWISLLLVRPILRRKAVPIPNFGALSRWSSPDMLVWGVIAGIGMILVAGQTLRLLAVNVLIILSVVYFFQGIAIVAFYFEKKRLPRMARVFLYSFIAMQQYLLFLVIGLGFFDVWMNFRRQGITEND